MRDAIEGRELDDLGVDHQEAELGRRLAEEQAHQHDVEPHALARAGRAGDDHVRHRGEVGEVGRADDVAPEHAGHRRLHLLEAAVLDELAQAHRDALLVGDLEADAVLARDGRDDADLAREPEREIIGEPGDLGDLGPRGGRDF